MPARQLEEIGAFGTAEAERMGEARQRIGRCLHVPALLEPATPCRADAGARREFLAAKSGRAPPPAPGGFHRLAAGADEGAEQFALFLINHGTPYNRINATLVTE